MRLLYILLFWIAAAALVVLAHGMLAAQVVAIVVAGLAYVRLTAPRATLQHALGVGIVWVVLSIGAELLRGYSLIGLPAHPIQRDLLLLCWIVAPALFARGHAPVHGSASSAP